MGMGGTDISALTTVKLIDAHSMSAPFLITAAGHPRRCATSPGLTSLTPTSRAVPEPLIASGNARMDESPTASTAVNRSSLRLGAARRAPSA